jgi:hypothetical protein
MNEAALFRAQARLWAVASTELGTARAAVQYVDTPLVAHVSNDLSTHHPGRQSAAWLDSQNGTLPRFLFAGSISVKKIPLELALAPREAPTHLSGRSCQANQACGGIVGADGAAAIDKTAGAAQKPLNTTHLRHLIRELRTAWAEPLRCMCPAAWVSSITLVHLWRRGSGQNPPDACDWQQVGG